MRQLPQIDKNGNFLDGSGKTVQAMPIAAKSPRAPKPPMVPIQPKRVVTPEPPQMVQTIPIGTDEVDEYVTAKVMYMVRLVAKGSSVTYAIERANRRYAS